MPFNSKLLSAVYWVSSPHKFKKPITVKIQHCAALSSDKQCSKLTFVRTKCTQKELPYTFKELAGGVFEPKNSYGSLSLSDFSGLAIGVKEATCQTGQEEIVEQCCAQLYITRKSVKEWKADFVVIKDLDSCLTVSAWWNFNCCCACSYIGHMYTSLHAGREKGILFSCSPTVLLQLYF